MDTNDAKTLIVPASAKKLHDRPIPPPFPVATFLLKDGPACDSENGYRYRRVVFFPVKDAPPVRVSSYDIAGQLAGNTSISKILSAASPRRQNDLAFYKLSDHPTHKIDISLEETAEQSSRGSCGRKHKFHTVCSLKGKTMTEDRHA